MNFEEFLAPRKDNKKPASFKIQPAEPEISDESALKAESVEQEELQLGEVVSATTENAEGPSEAKVTEQLNSITEEATSASSITEEATSASSISGDGSQTASMDYSAESLFAAADGAVDDSQKLEISNTVVEELAKESVEQKEVINSLRKQVNAQQSEIAALKLKIDEQNIALGKVGDILAKNAEGPESSKLALLERDSELPDRFEGETRDHVLEALKDARDAAEKDGRFRHAQILESVLCANEPNGTLSQKREELKKLFESNANLVSGPVIETLTQLGISHKNGEEYLLPSEILKRTY